MNCLLGHHNAISAECENANIVWREVTLTEATCYLNFSDTVLTLVDYFKCRPSKLTQEHNDITTQ